MRFWTLTLHALNGKVTMILGTQQPHLPTLYTTVMAMMANHLANDGKIKLNEYSISPFGV